uniref:Uncharacterized protein n=1 Tax=Amphiprion ocellaris TaxID=80972 RepID=A0AAQ6A946_AMPOC
MQGVQTTDCYRLKKTETRHEAEAATTTGVPEGIIVFGKAFQIGSGLESYIVDGTRRASSNGSVEDETSYQADFIGWEKGHIHDIGSKEAEWKRLSPTLQCLKDQMKFRAVGPAASQLLLDRGYAPPIPLSHIPPSCGYNVQKNSMALVMLIPFNGCNVYQKGGSYVVPMSWKGYPVSLLCPKPAYTTPAPQYIVPGHPPSHPNLKLPPLYFFPYPKYPVVLPDHVHKPELPKYPLYHHWTPYYQYLPHPPKTALPTASVHNFAHSHLFPFPLYQNVPLHYPQHYHGSQQSAGHLTVPAKPQVLDIPMLPHFPHFYQPQYPKHPVLDVTTTTEAPVEPTVTPPHLYYPPHGHPHYPPHGHPHGHPHYPPHDHPHYPPHDHPHYPPHGHPHGHPHYPPHGQKPHSHGDHIQLTQFPLP